MDMERERNRERERERTGEWERERGRGPRTVRVTHEETPQSSSHSSSTSVGGERPGEAGSVWARRAFRVPLSEFGTYKTVKARLWPWISGK